MLENPDKSAQVSHVILDVASVFRGGDGDESTLAAERLNDLDAISAKVTQTAASVHIDLNLTNVVVGASVVVDWLLAELSEARGVSREEVVVDARQHIDEFLAYRSERD